jgi:hypothetical protein
MTHLQNMSPARTPGAVDFRQLGLLVGMFAVAAIIWNWWVFFPFKVFVVLLHELSHGIAALLTGGSVVKITVSPDLGGVCYTRGGWDLLVIPAGYLGSMALGGAILLAASRTRADRILTGVIGGAIILVTLLFVRSWFGFGFGLLCGAALVALARFAPEWACDLLLKFLGLTSMLYAVIDIKEDLVARTVPSSDAWAMSQRLLLPPVFWGIFWLLLAVGSAAVVVWLAVRKPSSNAPAG